MYRESAGAAPTDKMSVELEAQQQWQLVIEVLADGTLREVMPLIQAIQMRLLAADRAGSLELGMRVPGGMSGAYEAAAIHE